MIRAAGIYAGELQKHGDVLLYGTLFYILKPCFIMFRDSAAFHSHTTILVEVMSHAVIISFMPPTSCHTSFPPSPALNHLHCGRSAL